MTFGEKLKELRESKNLSQREVGAAISVDAAFISKAEKGEKRISRDHLEKLSLFLGIDKDELETLWLANKLYQLVENEDLGHEALKVAEAEFLYHIKHKKS
jgi:transcriptional regulator with XRE-family HTH domain